MSCKCLLNYAIHLHDCILINVHMIANCTIVYHRPTGDLMMPQGLQVMRPLSMAGLQRLCTTTKELFNNNFPSFYLAVSGAVMALHCQTVIRLHDECPIVLCYSSSCGTGEYFADDP